MSNSTDLRQYWCFKYKTKFNSDYPSDKVVFELMLLKRLSDTYGYYTILEAIDKFIDKIPQVYCHLTYFAKPAIFKDNNGTLISFKRVNKYIRLLPCFPEEIRIKLKPMLQAYKICCNEFFSDADILEKQRLLIEIEKLTETYMKENSIHD